MKQGPDTQKLEDMMRSSKLVDGGFMGNDRRTINEVIDADAKVLEKLDYDVKHLARRMQEITDLAIKGLGTWVQVDENLVSKVDEAKGALVCPWPHAGNFAKRVTVLKNEISGQSICWSDLVIHMIGEHGFFEGKGSRLRVEPEKLTEMIL
ncbi:hypothetical protein LCGC14_2310040 [marine sediment metagenome]|uniref:Uncharacterized protein n=1 Tax=marine sediment metagenome TaxID=412755 RepID=A0A0F9CLE8_9ZZZZ|nr:hypothetical protein [Phycisphaerales bacterium]